MNTMHARKAQYIIETLTQLATEIVNADDDSPFIRRMYLKQARLSLSFIQRDFLAVACTEIAIEPRVEAPPAEPADAELVATQQGRETPGKRAVALWRRARARDAVIAAARNVVGGLSDDEGDWPDLDGARAAFKALDDLEVTPVPDNWQSVGEVIAPIVARVEETQ